MTRRGYRPLGFLSLGWRHAGAVVVAGVTLAAAASAETVEVDPDTLEAAIVSVSTEGVLCPAGSLGVQLSGPVATVIFSQSVAGVQTAGCRLTFVVDVPPELVLGMPTTVLRGVSIGRTRFERRYSFEGAGASNAFIDQAPDEFTIADRSGEIESRSCEGNRRVKYTVDVTAQVQEQAPGQDTFFQLDSVDLDTTFRFGTSYRFCDRRKTLVIEPGQDGDFCDGPQARPCDAGLVCDRERDPNSAEGTCAAP